MKMAAVKKKTDLSIRLQEAKLKCAEKMKESGLKHQMDAKEMKELKLSSKKAFALSNMVSFKIWKKKLMEFSLFGLRTTKLFEILKHDKQGQHRVFNRIRNAYGP